MFADHVPKRSAPTVARLLEAGAIMHARTTTPEMAHAPHCRSDLWGNTRNPWNLNFGLCCKPDVGVSQMALLQSPAIW